MYLCCKDKNQAFLEVEENIEDEIFGLRSLRGSPTNRHRIPSNANIGLVEKKTRTLLTDESVIQENDNATVAFLSITKKDGMSSCKGILFRPDWIMTSGHCADGALTITAWIGLNGTSFLPDDYTTANAELEHHFITKGEISMSPGRDSTNSDGEFAMLHLKVASNKTAALAKSDFQALGWYLVYDFWSDYWDWYWTDDCWIYAHDGWCNTCAVTCYYW